MSDYELLEILQKNILETKRAPIEVKKYDFEDWERHYVTCLFINNLSNEYLYSVLKHSESENDKNFEFEKGYIAGLKYSLDLFLTLKKGDSEDESNG